MDFKNILLIVVGLFNFVSAGYIFGRNRKSHINISFSLMYLFAGFWSFGVVAFLLTNNYSHANIFAIIYYIAAISIISSFYYFALSFPFPSYVIKLKNIIYAFLPSIIVSISILVPNILIGEISISESGNVIELEWGYYIYTAVLIILAVLGLILLIKKYGKSDGVSRMQIKLSVIGISISFIIGMIFNLFLPLFGNYNLIWIGPNSTIIAMGFIYYLISRKV